MRSAPCSHPRWYPLCRYHIDIDPKFPTDDVTWNFLGAASPWPCLIFYLRVRFYALQLGLCETRSCVDPDEACPNLLMVQWHLHAGGTLLVNHSWLSATDCWLLLITEWELLAEMLTEWDQQLAASPASQIHNVEHTIIVFLTPESMLTAA